VLEAIRGLATVLYIQALGQRYLSVSDSDLHTCFNTIRPVAYVDSRQRSKSKQPHQLSELHVSRSTNAVVDMDLARKDALEKFCEHLLYKRYSPRTIKTHTIVLCSPGCIRNHIRGCITRMSTASWHGSSFRRSTGYHAGIRKFTVLLFFHEVLHSNIQSEKLQRPRREYKLQEVLRKVKVNATLLARGNLKPCAMLRHFYACGLCREELLNLKPFDIESTRRLFFVRCGKERKDCVIPVSEKRKEMLREYAAYRPTLWLFEGQAKGSQYSKQSLQSDLKQALAKKGIKSYLAMAEAQLLHAFA